MAERNYWVDEACAEAFWHQHHALPYQELLDDTALWMHVCPGDRWLDLGCGAGHLTAELWARSRGKVGEIVAMDCAAANARAIAKLRRRLQPTPGKNQLRFVHGNFSDGLAQFETDSFDGIVSGLAISYAESFDEDKDEYSDAAYNRLLAEMCRVLKPQGRLIFSVNVPRPNFWRIFRESLSGAHQLSKPAKTFVSGLKMQRYGRWLCREAEKGRFHYFPIEEIRHRLANAGFGEITDELSYADQAYIVCASKTKTSASIAA